MGGLQKCLNQGDSIRSIAVALGKSFGSVRNYFKNAVLYATGKPSCRPKKLTALDARRVIRHVRQEPGIHSSALFTRNNLTMSPRTVRRLLQNTGFIWKKKKRMQSLKDYHKQAGMEFAQIHQTWTSEW